VAEHRAESYLYYVALIRLHFQLNVKTKNPKISQNLFRLSRFPHFYIVSIYNHLAHDKMHSDFPQTTPD